MFVLAKKLEKEKTKATRNKALHYLRREAGKETRARDKQPFPTYANLLSALGRWFPGERVERSSKRLHRGHNTFS